MPSLCDLLFNTNAKTKAMEERAKAHTMAKAKAKALAMAKAMANNKRTYRPEIQWGNKIWIDSRGQ